MRRPTTVKGVLRSMLRLFEDPKHWTKDSFARPSRYSKRDVSSLSKEAGCWCMLGALEKITYSREIDMPDWRLKSEAEGVLEQAILDCGYAPSGTTSTFGVSIATFNDAKTRTIAQVRRVIEHAIKAA